MRNKGKIVTKILKMSEQDAAMLDRLAYLAQRYYREANPGALAVELPSSSHVLRALIRYADGITATDPQTADGQKLVERCATGGGRWDY
jgi:hypothetical protein